MAGGGASADIMLNEFQYNYGLAKKSLHPAIRRSVFEARVNGRELYNYGTATTFENEKNYLMRNDKDFVWVVL